MAEHKEKFIVINKKHLKNLYFGEQPKLVDEFYVAFEKLQPYLPDNKYIVCNRDEPYATNVLAQILRGEIYKGSTDTILEAAEEVLKK